MRVNLVNLPSSPVFRALLLLFIAAALLAVVCLIDFRGLENVRPVVGKVCLAIDGTLFATFVLVILYEQIQDKALQRGWERDRKAGRALPHRQYLECPRCGFTRNRGYDRCCLGCSRPLTGAGRGPEEMPR